MDQHTTLNTALIDHIMEQWDRNPHHLLQMLIHLQEQTGYLSAEHMDYLAAQLALPRAQIEGVIGFYSFLYTEPQGQYRVLFSDNITDRMQGNMDLLEYMCRKMWTERGKLSSDGLLSIDTTSCTGLCDQGPGLLVNNMAINQIDRSRLDQICALMQQQLPLHEWPEDLFKKQSNIQRKDIILDSDFQSGSALKAALERGPDAMLKEIKTSRLRGRGGAGFSTGMKWEFCQQADGDQHYVVCNADEGEPGTFKDRVLLTDYADMVFEGMTICAQVLGAGQGFLYLRGEYRYLLPYLEQILQRRRDNNLLGRDILGHAGFNFDIDIHLGAGAYICGEESALIESLEGKRGTPRNRPPFPVTHGYLNQPTVVNNVETFAAGCLVALKGGQWYCNIGTESSSGTKILSVAGDCARPGLYEYPYGVTVAQVLHDCGAENTQAVQISGPSGECISADEFERQIAFDDLPTAGAFTVFDQRRDLFEVARNYTHFFAHESCGFCTPCRIGTSLLRNMMDKLANGHGSPYDFNEIEKMNQLLLSTSHCGLGHTACNPVLDTIKKFRPVYDKRLMHQSFVPAFDLEHALSQSRQLTGRDDAEAHLKQHHD